MGRAPCCQKVGLKKGRWTAEEDEILAKYIQANGEGSWRSLPKNAGLLRCGKSCRLRWINYLRADLRRGNISAEEENTIVKLHTSFGNRWSLIASHLPGRTDNEIKNYWNSHLSRKIYSFPKIITTTDDNTPEIAPIPPKRKGGRTSRWAMKNNKIYPRKDTQKPKDSITQQNNEAAVPPPPTPSLERENLMDTDTRREEEVEVNGTYEKNLVDGVKESNDDDILGLCEFEGINDDGSGALCISDMLDSYLGETCGVLSLSEERESSNDVWVVGGENERGDDDACLNKIESIEGSVNNLSSNGKIGDWSSPMTLELDDNSDCFSARSKVFSTKDNSVQIEDTDNWDWESVIEFNNINFNNSESDAYDWKHKENLLTWLWEDDDWESDCKKLGETDPQIQNDMVAWFLS